MVGNLVACYPVFQISALSTLDKLVERHNAQLQHDTQGHTLKELPVGSTVGYRDHANNQFHLGVVSGRKGRLYAISTESGRILSRNQIDLKWTNVPYVHKESVSYASSKHVSPPPNPDNTNVKFKQPNKAKLLEKEITVRKSNSGIDVYRTHSGHISKPATRLFTSM